MPEYAGIPDKQWKDVPCNYVSITAWDTLTKKKKKSYSLFKLALFNLI